VAAGESLCLVGPSGCGKSTLLRIAAGLEPLLAGRVAIDGTAVAEAGKAETPPEARKRLAELWAALNADPEMKELAAKSGFELVNVGLDQMDTFMRERAKVYTEVGRAMGLGKKP
jgi:ABC-type cobalamin/Fe3+-siderophores transport system ATPase subunit